MTQSPMWLEWPCELQAMSQNGFAYRLSEYDKERYSRLREIAAEIVAAPTHVAKELALEAFDQQIGNATPSSSSSSVRSEAARRA